MFRSYSATKRSGSFYITLFGLKQITKQTPLFALEDSLFNSFHLQSAKLNIMELFASLVTYSSAPCKLKVKLAFLIFDFDSSKNLNKAEMAILVISFIRGIASMTNSILVDGLDLETLGKQYFDLVNSKPQGLISLTDLVNWVQGTPEIVSLLSKHETAKGVQKRRSLLKPRKKSVNYGRSCSIVSESRRASQSLNSRLPSVKNRVEWKNKERDIQRLHDLFYKHADNGYSLVGQIYPELVKNKRFSKDSEFFFHEFDFNMNKTIEFSQLVDFMEKVKSKNGYFVKVGKELVYPSNELIKTDQKFMANIGVLKKMFSEFDKNKDGFLSFAEMKEGLKKHFTKQAVIEIFGEFDKDGNKLIDFAEFLEIFSPYHKFAKSKKV